MEGILDAVHHPEGLALFGKVLYPGQLDWLKKIQPKEIVICLDGDAVSDALEMGRKLVREGNWTVSVVRLPWDTDPDEVNLEEYLCCRETIG